MIFEHIMDPSWNYKPYKNKINPYFREYGFCYSVVEGEHYKQMTVAITNDGLILIEGNSSPGVILIHCFKKVFIKSLCHISCLIL